MKIILLEYADDDEVMLYWLTKNKNKRDHGQLFELRSTECYHGHQPIAK